MKKMKKIASVALALVMALALMVPAFAAGSNTITVENAAKGATYTLYKIFDAKVVENRPTNGADGITYSYNGTLPASLAAVFVKNDKDDTINVVNPAPTSEDIMAAVKAYAEATPAAKVGDPIVNEDGGAVVFTGLVDGYYAVLSNVSEGNMVTITSIAPNATVYDKNSAGDKPSNAQKTLSTQDGTVLTDKTVSIGETVYYSVSVNTVNWTDEDGDNTNGAEYKVTSYTVTDTRPNFLTGLKIASAKVTEPDGTVHTLEVPANAVTMTIDWDDEDGNHLYPSGSILTVIYTATVNEGILAEGDHTNTATINYNDKKVPGDDPSEDVYTYNFQMAKTDGETTTLLAGAKFDLYDAVTGGNKIDLVKVDDNTWRVASAAEKAADGFASAEIVSNADSVITIQGLANGSYYLEETEAPAGYNKLTVRTEAVTINNADSNIAADGVEWVGNGIQVVNESGAVLPATGGMGTTIFYALGGILVAGSAILLITKKRMGSDD